MTTVESASAIVVSRNRFLYQVGGGPTNHGEENRFVMKGIAFPDPPPLKPPTATPDNPHPGKPGFNYNATAWIAILKQLRQAIPDPEALNTVRIYRIDPTLDYSEFFQAAQELGFYILVPLTSVSQKGAILNRGLAAPKCYPKTLLEYGKSAWENYGKYPNVLAGVIGNEVMNGLDSWYAAPCVKAYARDLQIYMRNFAETHSQSPKYENRTWNDQLLTLPLLYAAQHSGIGAALTETDTIRLTVDYLTCHEEDDESVVNDIDIFGINVESWCSSYDTFESNRGYYQLYEGLANAVNVPIVFSELGCSHLEFDKDNLDIKTPEGTRDWRQVPVVLQDMKATFSGFCAYAYWGNSLFNMMEDGPWDGKNPLAPAQDFLNFQDQLMKALSLDEESSASTKNDDLLTSSSEKEESIFHDLPMVAGGIMDEYYHQLDENPNVSPTCSQVQTVLQTTCDLKLADMSRMPNYAHTNIVKYDLEEMLDSVVPTISPDARFIVDNSPILVAIIGVAVLALMGAYFVRRRDQKPNRSQYEVIP